MRKIWAIFGLAGTGKSSVSKILEQYDFFVINQDLLGHEVLNECSEELSEIFGKEILEGKSVDRKKLANHVFSDSKKRNLLMDFSYPLIIRKTNDLIHSTNRSIVIEGALFYRVREQISYDKLLYIEVNHKILVDRLHKRGHDSQWIKNVLEQQQEIIDHKFLADWVLDNSQDKAYLEKQITDLLIL